MRVKTLLAVLVTSLAAFCAGAANMSERSPFAQGHWWDPAQPGRGFEIFNAAVAPL